MPNHGKNRSLFSSGAAAEKAKTPRQSSVRHVAAWLLSRARLSNMVPQKRALFSCSNQPTSPRQLSLTDLTYIVHYTVVDRTICSQIVLVYKHYQCLCYLGALFIYLLRYLLSSYTANLYRDYREFTGITCTLYRVFPVTGKNL